MSDITVCLRQGDVTRSSNKRPLSIIKEYDTDDHEAADLSSTSSNRKESSPEIQECAPVLEDRDVSGQLSHVITYRQLLYPQSLLLPDKCSAPSPVTCEPRPAGTEPLPHTSTNSSSRPTVITRLTESDIPAADDISALGKLDSVKTTLVTNKLENVSKIKDADDYQLTTNATMFSLFWGNELAHPKQGQQGWNSGKNGWSQLDGSDEILNVQRTCGDGQGLSIIRETAERALLTSPASPTPQTPSFPTLSPKFGRRQFSQAWTTNDGRTMTGQMAHISGGCPPILVSLALATSPDSEDSKAGRFLADVSTSQPQSSRSYLLAQSKLKLSKLSVYFSRRMSNESTGSLSESDLSDGDATVDEPHAAYLRRLQETAEMLRLSTRRPSTLLWKQQFMECSGLPRLRSNPDDENCDDQLTSDRKQKIDTAIQWLRSELQEMRSQDQTLARQLLAIWHDIHKLKLQRSTEEHQDLIDDFHSELQELQEFSDFLDLPLPDLGDNPLKHIGVTRLNISARRFSAC